MLRDQSFFFLLRGYLALSVVIKLKALQEERMGMLMVGRETCGVV